MTTHIPYYPDTPLPEDEDEYDMMIVMFRLMGVPQDPDVAAYDWLEIAVHILPLRDKVQPENTDDVNQPSQDLVKGSEKALTSVP